MKHRRVIQLIVLLAIGWGFATAAVAKPADSAWPVTSFITEKSVLANYYREFIQGTAPEDSARQMKYFCNLLLHSDLLADRLNMLGGKPDELHATLRELSEYQFVNPNHFSKEDRQAIRGLLLGLDINLESIDRALSSGTRREFRREVLADIPPLNRVGLLFDMPRTATQVMMFLLPAPAPIVNLHIA